MARRCRRAFPGLSTKAVVLRCLPLCGIRILACKQSCCSAGDRHSRQTAAGQLNLPQICRIKVHMCHACNQHHVAKTEAQHNHHSFKAQDAACCGLRPHHEGGSLMPGHVGRAPPQQHPALRHQVWHPLKVHLCSCDFRPVKRPRASGWTCFAGDGQMQGPMHEGSD